VAVIAAIVQAKTPAKTGVHAARDVDVIGVPDDINANKIISPAPKKLRTLLRALSDCGFWA
jgi:hypothetical protein